MFTINYNSHSGRKNSISVIDEEYALTMFNQLLNAVDLEEIAIIDGLTGEVLYMWENGKFTILKGYEV